ncbi:hypothetical protein [Bradyrhizobium cenepequi]
MSLEIRLEGAPRSVVDQGSLRFNIPVVLKINDNQLIIAKRDNRIGDPQDCSCATWLCGAFVLMMWLSRIQQPGG